MYTGMFPNLRYSLCETVTKDKFEITDLRVQLHMFIFF